MEFKICTKCKKRLPIDNFQYYSMNKTLEEIVKCVLLCSNCHREFHYLQNKENLSLESFLQ